VSDPITAIANRLGVERARITVPLEALRPASCGDGDQVFLELNGSGSPFGSVEGLWGRETLNELWRLHVLVSAGPGLSPSSFVDAAAALKIETNGGMFDWTGIVTAFASLGSEDGLPLYVATIEPKLARSAHRGGFSVYSDSKLGDIVSTFASEYDLSPILSLPDETIPHKIQWNETDLVFLKRLAEEAGAFFYTDGTSLVVSDHTSDFLAGPTLPYLGPFADPDGHAATVSSFAAAASSNPGPVTVRGWDYLNKETVEGTSGPAGPGLLVYEPTNTTRELVARAARNLYERALMEANERRGTSNSPGIRAGHELNLSGGGAGFSGSYYVTSASHVIHRESGDGCFVYGNDFTAVPSSVPYRPARVTPRPRIKGVQTAVVLQVVDDPEGLGRIRVRFPWDARGDGSAWARLAFANGGESLWTLPMVGDEVLVGFVDGDPREPVILGGLFNGVDIPPPASP
jgi:type VI secretion system secreted protein VgrG